MHAFRVIHPDKMRIGGRHPRFREEDVDKSGGYSLGNPQAGYFCAFNPRQRVFLMLRRRILSAAGGTQKHADEVMQGKSGENALLMKVLGQEAASICAFNEFLGMHAS